MYKNKKVSLIFPSFNQENAIFKAIQEFQSTNLIDEVIAVDNNSTDKTSELIKKTDAKYVLETVQAYGSTISKSLRVATGEPLVITDL